MDPHALPVRTWRRLCALTLRAQVEPHALPVRTVMPVHLCALTLRAQVEPHALHCVVNNACVLEGALLTVKLDATARNPLPCLGAQDEAHLKQWAAATATAGEAGAAAALGAVEFLALPRTRGAADVDECRALLARCGWVVAFPGGQRGKAAQRRHHGGAAGSLARQGSPLRALPAHAVLVRCLVAFHSPACNGACNGCTRTSTRARFAHCAVHLPAAD